jgi:hypothetical protein
LVGTTPISAPAILQRCSGAATVPYHEPHFPPIVVWVDGVCSVILQVFRNEDRISTWLAFGLIWLACAAAALASAYLVYRVAETRKRLFNE